MLTRKSCLKHIRPILNCYLLNPAEFGFLHIFLFCRGKNWFHLVWLSYESCCELSDLIQFSGHVQCCSFLKERSIRTGTKNALKELKNCQIFTADVRVLVS